MKLNTEFIRKKNFQSAFEETLQLLRWRFKCFWPRTQILSWYISRQVYTFLYALDSLHNCTYRIYPAIEKAVLDQKPGWRLVSKIWSILGWNFRSLQQFQSSIKAAHIWAHYSLTAAHQIPSYFTGLPRIFIFLALSQSFSKHLPISNMLVENILVAAKYFPLCLEFNAQFFAWRPNGGSKRSWIPVPR